MGTEAVDFNAIFNVQRADYSRLQPAITEDRAELPQQQKSPSDRQSQPHNDITEARTRLQREADRRKQEREKYLRVLAEQQEAIRKAGNLRSEILHGIRQGEEPIALLLKACECIAKQTGDEMFYLQAKEDTRTIYGHVLGNPYPLQQEYAEVQERLNRLINAEGQEADPAQKRRLQGAIREHRKKLMQIEKSLHS